MVSELSTQLTQEIEFRPVCQVEIPGGGADLGGGHDEKCSVLAASDACGVLLVSTSWGLHVIRIRDIERDGVNAVERGKAGSMVQFNAIASPSLGSRPSFIDISRDGGVVAIAVGGSEDGGLSVVSLHHMALLCKGNCEEAFCTKDFDSMVTALRIRPPPRGSHSSQQQPEVLVVTKAGEAAVVRSSGSVDSITRGEELSYTAGDWSPSGEMIALGCSNSCDFVVLNTSSLDIITLQNSRPTEAELTEEGYKRLDYVAWLSDNLLYAVYCSTEDSDGELMVTSSGVLWKIAQGGSQAEPVAFDDGVCFPSFGVPSTTHHQFYLSAVLKGDWKAAILASSVSADIPLLLERGGEWILGEPDEDYQITLPMTSNDQNTFPRGLAVSLNASMSLSYREDSDPPSPLVFVMNNEGLLKMYAFLDRGRQSTQNEEVLQEPKAIPSPINIITTPTTATVAASTSMIANVDDSITPDKTNQPTEFFSVFGTGSKPPLFNFGKPSIIQTNPGFSFGGSAQSKISSFDIAARHDDAGSNGKCDEPVVPSAPPLSLGGTAAPTTAPSTSIGDSTATSTTKALTSSIFGGSSLYTSADKKMEGGSEVSSSGPTMSFDAPTSSFMAKQISSSATAVEETTLKPLASSSGDQVGGGGVKIAETKLSTLSFGSLSTNSKETTTPFERALDHGSGEAKNLTSKAAPVSFGEKLDTAAVAKTGSKPSVPSGSGGYPPMSSKAPTPFGASTDSKVDSKPSAVPSGSGGYPPMNSKAPTPFGASTGSKVDSKPSAVPSGSGGYPPMSSKAPTLFGASTGSKVDSKPSAVPSGSGGYPPMSSKAPMPFGASTGLKVDSKPSAVPSGSSYPPMSSKAPMPFGASTDSKVDSKPSAVPSGSGGYPPMSSKAPTPFGASTGSKVDSKPSAVPSGSSYPPMSSKAPMPFGASTGSKVDSKPSAVPSGSSYPPMSSKAPTPFGASTGSKVDSKPSAVPFGSGGYPPMSSKAPTIFGEKPPAATLITAKSESKPTTTFDGEYRSISSRAVAPSQAKGVVLSTGEVEALKSMSIYESNTWDIISNFDATLQELRRWHGLLEEDWKEEFDKCVQSALNASQSLRNDLCSLEASLQVGERDIHETKGNMAELKWQTVETSSLLLEASSPNYLRLLETQELEKPAAVLRDAISLSAAKLADTIVTLQQVLALRANLKEGGDVVQPEKLPHALVSSPQPLSQPAYAAGRISFGGSAQKRLGFGYGAKPRRGSSDKLNPEKGPQLVRIGTYHRPSCTEDFSSGNRKPSQPPNISTAAMALLRIVSSTYQRSKEAEATWQGLKNTSSIVEEELLSKRSGITDIHKDWEGKTNAIQEGGHGSATNSKNGNRQVNNAQLTRRWKQKLLCLLMDEAGMCTADHVTEISSHACSSYSLPLLGSGSQRGVAATSVSDILKEKQRGVSLLLPSGTLSGIPKMPDLPMPIAPRRMAARIPEEWLVVRPATAAAAASAKPGELSRKLGPSPLTFDLSLPSKASSTPSAGRLTSIAPPPVLSATSQVVSQKGQVLGSSGAFNEGLSKLKGTTCNNTASKKIPNAFSIPEASSRVTTQVTSFQGRDTNPPAISSVQKTENIPETAICNQQQQQLVSESKATIAAAAAASEEEDSSSSAVSSSKTSVSKSLFQSSSSSTTTEVVVPSTNKAKQPSLTTSELKGGDTLGPSSSSTASPFDNSSSKPAATKKEDIGITPVLKQSPAPAGSCFDNTPTKSLFGNLTIAAAPLTPSNSSDLKKPAVSGGVSEPLITPTVTTTPLHVESSSNQVINIRSEIVKIYEKYNPSKVGNVEQLLAKYKGNEQTLLVRIKEKYSKVSDSSALNVPGTPQTQAAVAPSTPATCSVFGSALGSLGTSSVNQPATPSLFGVPKSGGGPSPAKGSIFGTSASKAGADINPFGGGATSTQQQQQTPSAFSHSSATSNTIMAPFGTMSTVSANTPSFSSSTTMTGTSYNFSEMLRQWMVNVYQKHDPPRASKVDSLLAKYSGKEAEVVARLVQKYNEHPPQQLQAELQSRQQQQQQAPSPQQGPFGGSSSFGMGGGGGIFGTQQQRGFGVMPSSTFGATPAVQPMTGSGVSAGFGSAAFGTSSGVMGLKGQESSSGFGGYSSVSKGQVGFGALAQQQPQSGTFGTSSTFAEASKPNAFTGANFTQMRG